MKYKCLNKNLYKEDGFEIRPISINDIENIRLWRNQQMDVLRQKKEISYSDQIKYFNNIILPLFSDSNPTQILFSYFKDEILIGYGGLVHIAWDDQRCEMSFLLNPLYILNDSIYQYFFSKFIKFMIDISFNQLNFHKLFTETYSHRTHHIDILINSGFELEGILRDHVVIDNKYFNSLIHSILNHV